MPPHVTVNGKWGNWNPFGPCNATCGGGTKVRNRTCDDPEPKFNGTTCEGYAQSAKKCSLPACPGG